MDEVDAALRASFIELFGPVEDAPPPELTNDAAAIASHSAHHHIDAEEGL
jgi:hypothetical protein